MLPVTYHTYDDYLPAEIPVPKVRKYCTVGGMELLLPILDTLGTF